MSTKNDGSPYYGPIYPICYPGLQNLAECSLNPVLTWVEFCYRASLRTQFGGAQELDENSRRLSRV